MLRVLYNGYYVTFPRLKRGFDSLHPLMELRGHLQCPPEFCVGVKRREPSPRTAATEHHSQMVIGRWRVPPASAKKLRRAKSGNSFDSRPHRYASKFACEALRAGPSPAQNALHFDVYFIS